METAIQSQCMGKNEGGVSKPNSPERDANSCQIKISYMYKLVIVADLTSREMYMWCLVNI